MVLHHTPEWNDWLWHRYVVVLRSAWCLCWILRSIGISDWKESQRQGHMWSDSSGLDTVSSCRGVTVSTKPLCGQTQSLSIAKEEGRSVTISYWIHLYFCSDGKRLWQESNNNLQFLSFTWTFWFILCKPVISRSLTSQFVPVGSFQSCPWMYSPSTGTMLLVTTRNMYITAGAVPSGRWLGVHYQWWHKEVDEHQEWYLMLDGPGLVTDAEFRKCLCAREQGYLEPMLSPSLLMTPHAGREIGGGGKWSVFLT